ncbi:hypothetical protein B1813_11085 [Saccharomonospora piscinae]|uniref:DUF2530 domain-containing protein n=1 Tax=Saccharomonospora piscinae TaxID=687388 RepID=A0A1V9A7V8_SACPI|nr:hypothetical protein B1813_11085 [Saccharomonospora piscinae]TLW92401.1 DUF2530 domain-containing protein [Saccharomonospora piscinae]
MPTSVVSPWIPVVGGTAVWLIASVVLLATGVHGMWLWTALTGGGLGLVGMAVMLWQRAASRRGSRFAQRNL